MANGLDGAPGFCEGMPKFQAEELISERLLTGQQVPDYDQPRREYSAQETSHIIEAWIDEMRKTIAQRDPKIVADYLELKERLIADYVESLRPA